MMIKRAYDAQRTPLLYDPCNGLVKRAESRAEKPFFNTVAGVEHLPMDMQRFIRSDFVADTDNFCYLLINALGDEETYGANTNGDAMPRTTSTDGRSPCLAHTGEEHGYKTFEHWGHWYNYHQSDDPENAMGYIAFASYDLAKGIVIILLGIDRSKDPITASEVDAGQMPLTSMGHKTPFDICTKCASMYGTREMVEKWADEWFADAGLQEEYEGGPGEYVLWHNDQHIEKHGYNIPGLARWTKQYCPHIHLERGQMNYVEPDTGLKWYNINHFPRFFDMSKVFVGADKVSMGLTKLASANMTKTRGGLYVPQGIVDVRCKPYTSSVAPASQFGSVTNPYDADARTTYHFLDLEDQHKEAELKKRVETEGGVKVDEKSIERNARRVVRAVRDTAAPYMDIMDRAQPPLPQGFWDKSYGKPLGRVVASLKICRITPKPEEFQRMMLRGLGMHNFAERAHRAGACFDNMDIPESVMAKAESRHGDMLRSFFVDESGDQDIVRSLGEAMPSASKLPQFYFPRMRKTASIVDADERSVHEIASGMMPDMSAVALAQQKSSDFINEEGKDENIARFMAEQKSRKRLGLLETMALAALAYPMFHNSLGKAMGSTGRSALPAISKKQGAAIAAAALAGDTALDWMEPHPEGEPDLKAINNAAHQVKVAGILEYAPWSKNGGKAFLGALAAMPLIHGYSLHQRRKAVRGEQLGDIERWVALNPDAASLGYLAAAPVAGRFLRNKGGDVMSKFANAAPMYQERMPAPPRNFKEVAEQQGKAALNYAKTHPSSPKRAVPKAIHSALSEAPDSAAKKSDNPYTWEDRVLSGLTWGMMTPAAMVPSFIGGVIDNEIFHQLLG